MDNRLEELCSRLLSSGFTGVPHGQVCKFQKGDIILFLDHNFGMMEVAGNVKLRPRNTNGVARMVEKAILLAQKTNPHKPVLYNGPAGLETR
jgi:hypothetical protein